MRLHLLCFILFLTSTLKAQLREFSIAEMPRPEVAVVQANAQFPEDALVLVYAAIEGLEFRSSLGAIDKQTYNASASRYELLLKPVKQMLFAAKAGFIEAKITTLNPNPKDVYYFRVEEKKDESFSNAQPSKLSISSEPFGADIYLNGFKVVDKTPFTFDLNAGITRVKLTKQKYEDFDTTVQVQSNESINVSVKLKKKKILDKTDYAEIKIGNQVWMADNLNTEWFQNGDLIPEIKSNDEWERAGEEGRAAWCYYDNKLKYGEQYGRLYNWYAVTDSRGLCPTGWHVPSDLDWSVLTDYLGGVSGAASKMKSNKGWSFNKGNTNSSGFNGLPGGNRSLSGYCLEIESSGTWWSTTTERINDAWCRKLFFNHGDVYRYDARKYEGFSVRCLRD
jgi:uncharacterized protein (TIGR02145 family)